MKSVNFRDLTGQVFGRLTVIKVGPKHPKYNKWQWVCKCTCGKEVLITSGYCLTSGNSRSCGCATDEARKTVHVTHGHSKDLLYRRWKNIKSRCFNPNNPDYPGYGERGITLYPQWVSDFEAFRIYITELYPNIEELLRNRKTIDRLDTNKNYEPGNIRIVTNTVNAGNKRASYKIVLFGKTQCLQSWMEELQIPNPAYTKRIFSKDPLKALGLSPREYTCVSLSNRYYVIEPRTR